MLSDRVDDALIHRPDSSLKNRKAGHSFNLVLRWLPRGLVGASGARCPAAANGWPTLPHLDQFHGHCGGPLPDRRGSEAVQTGNMGNTSIREHR
jgi:hypothetical protein